VKRFFHIAWLGAAAESAVVGADVMLPLGVSTLRVF
jgi:hypothetical protein